MPDTQNPPPSADPDLPGDAPELAGLRCSQVWGGNTTAWAEVDLPGLTGWVASRPHHGQRAGGDVHYVSSCGTGRITRLLLADVSGHGEAVAETARRLRDAMSRYFNHIDPGKLAARMNRDMVEISERGEADSGGSADVRRFATAIVLTYFAPESRMTVCNAGHPPPLVYRHRSKQWRALASPDDLPDLPDAEDDDGSEPLVQNLPLGVLEDVGYRGQSVRLWPGDAVLVYTDCLTEAMNERRRMLGVAGLTHLLEALPGDPASEAPATLINALIDAIRAAGYAFDDDLTAVLLRSDGPSSGATPARRAAGVLRSLTAPLRRRPPPWPEFSRKNLIDPLCFWRENTQTAVE